MLLEQPWRVAGRRIATPPASLDAGLRAAAAALRGPAPPSWSAAGPRGHGRPPGAPAPSGAVGCLALSFPLHPPGRPEKSRADELAGAGVPVLVVQGERDPMGRPEEFPADLPDLDMAVVPAADHGLKVPARAPLSQDEAMEIVVESTLEWLVREVVGSR